MISMHLLALVTAMSCVSVGSDVDEDTNRHTDAIDDPIDPGDYRCSWAGPCNQTVFPESTTNILVNGHDEVFYAWVRPEDLPMPETWQWVGTGNWMLENPSVPPEAGSWVFVSFTTTAIGDVNCTIDSLHTSRAETFDSCCYTPPDWPGYDPSRMTWFYVEEGAEPIDWKNDRDEGPFDPEICRY